MDYRERGESNSRLLYPSCENKSTAASCIPSTSCSPPNRNPDSAQEKSRSGAAVQGRTSRIMDVEDEASASMAEEEGEEDAGSMALGPQVPLKDHLQLNKDGEDDSLRRWKEQLLGDVDTSKLGESAEPEVTVLNLAILAPGRPDLVLPIPFSDDGNGHAAFVLKDGSPYSFRFSFAIANNIVSGLKYSHTVWKAGVRVENQKVMLGTFGPRQEPYTYDAEEDTTPSGIFARGSYSAKLKFVDDDGKVYLDMRYCFEIRKDWGGVA